MTPQQIPRWRLCVAQWDMSHNAIPLALFAYTGLLQTLSVTSTALRIPAAVWTAAFFVSLLALAVSALLTLLRVAIHPAGLAADFRSPRLVNFFFLPSIIGSLALLTAPPFLRSYAASVVGLYLLAAYQSILALYLFGEWLFKKPITGSIYPLVFMQTIAFFLLSILASTLHLPEHAVAMLSVGSLLWAIVLVTNFQHLSESLSSVSERPAPTFFLFIAPPAQAVIAVLFLSFATSPTSTPPPPGSFLDVAQITEFPELSKAAMYVDLFLYALMFRLFPTWWRTKFSVAWWAYVFPMSAATCAVAWRLHVSNSVFFLVLACGLFAVASFAVGVVACVTVWAVATGRLPRNAMREREYREMWGKSDEFGEVASESTFDTIETVETGDSTDMV